MKNKYVLITGSDGLVGSECVEFFYKLGFSIIGLDNNYREKFFGKDASVLWNRERLKNLYTNYNHYDIDIVNSSKVEAIFKEYGDKLELIIHCAAQPSHDWAATNPVLDFQVNSLGTLNLLESTKKYAKDTPFIFTSTNKVYGDNPNKINLIETETRFTTTPESKYKNGFNEELSVDNTMHSLFGVSKLSADIMVQEYGKYFNMKTVSFRGGCLTGPNHSGTLLHGFLSYLMKCTISGEKYSIFGYKGKQVRDNIHSSDLISAFYEFYMKPSSGENYNIGGGLKNNCSMLEAIKICEDIVGSNLNYEYLDENRKGDHKWYISDLKKFESHYPNWNQEYTLHQTLEEIADKNIKRWRKIN
tara:strand:- start:581 stop:1657 length:1077 start_codon:yes stop_codon:yes gene_type:complete